MRGLLSLFIEVSAGRGEWAAALSAVQAAGIPLYLPSSSSCLPSSATSTATAQQQQLLLQVPPSLQEALTGSDVLLLTRMLLAAGKPKLAMALGDLPPRSICISIPSAATADAIGDGHSVNGRLTTRGGSDGLVKFLEAQQLLLAYSVGGGGSSSRGSPDSSTTTATPAAAEFPLPVCDWVSALRLVSSGFRHMARSCREDRQQQLSTTEEHVTSINCDESGDGGDATSKQDEDLVRGYYDRTRRLLAASLPPSATERGLASLTGSWEAFLKARRQQEAAVEVEVAATNAAAVPEHRNQRMEDEQKDSGTEAKSGGQINITTATSDTDSSPSSSSTTATVSSGDESAAAASQLLSQLRRIHDDPKAGSSWSDALAVLSRMPAVTPDAFCLVAHCLTRQGREQDMIRLVNSCFSFLNNNNHDIMNAGLTISSSSSSLLMPRLEPTPRLLKSIAEAAHAMHSLPLCTAILDSPKLSAALAPSSAVPLVLALQELGQHDRVLRWWQETVMSPPATTTVDETKELGVVERIPSPSSSSSSSPSSSLSSLVAAASLATLLRGHLKLCNYVAVCYLKSNRPRSKCSGSVGDRRGPLITSSSSSSTATMPKDSHDGNGGTPRAALVHRNSDATAIDLRPRWAVALSLLEDARPRDPALALLFSLRLLRVARAWEAALALVRRELIEPLVIYGKRISNNMNNSSGGDDNDGRHHGTEGCDGGESGHDAAVAAAAVAAWLPSKSSNSKCNRGRSGTTTATTAAAAAKTARDIYRLLAEETPRQWIPARQQAVIAKEAGAVVFGVIIASASSSSSSSSSLSKNRSAHGSRHWETRNRQQQQRPRHSSHNYNKRQ